MKPMDFQLVQLNESVIKTVKQVTCKYSNNQMIFRDAILKESIEICECFNDSDKKDECQKAVVDISLYNQAISQYDESLCDSISDQNKQISCKKIVKSGIDYLRKNDPKQLAQTYILNNNEKAIGEYEKLVQDNPNDLDYLISLILAYAGKGLNIQEQGGDQTFYINKALELIERVEQIDLENARIYRAKGYVYEIKPDLWTAIKNYDKALEIDPDYILAYAGRGHAKSMLGLLESALQDFEKAAELDKNNEYIFVYANLCRLQSSKDDLREKAIINCDIAVNNKSEGVLFKSEANQILADLYMQNSEFDRAKNYLLTAKTLTPNNVNLYISFSKLNIAEEEYQKAEKNALEAIAISITKSIAYQILAYSLYQQGNFDEAIIQAEKGLGLVENDVSLLEPNKLLVKKDFYYTLANIYHFKEDVENEKKYKELGDNIFE